MSMIDKFLSNVLSSRMQHITDENRMNDSALPHNSNLRNEMISERTMLSIIIVFKCDQENN